MGTGYSSFRILGLNFLQVGGGHVLPAIGHRVPCFVFFNHIMSIHYRPYRTQRSLNRIRGVEMKALTVIPLA